MSNIPMVAVVLPTRGLVFTEVIEALESYKRKCFLDIYYSYNLPIPDAQNILTDENIEKIFNTHKRFLRLAHWNSCLKLMLILPVLIIR